MTLMALWRRGAPYRWQLLLISLLSVASSSALLAIPWLSGSLLGDLMATGSLTFERVLVLLMLALCANAVFSIASSIASARVSGRVLADLRCEVYDHVQSLPIAYHDSARQGDLLALVSYEVSHLSRFLTSSLARIPSMVLTAVGSIVLLFLIDPLVAVIVPVLLPVFLLVFKLVGRHLRELSQGAREADAWMIAQAEEDLAMLPAIKALAVEQQRRERYAHFAHLAFRRNFAVERIRAVLGPLVALVAAAAAIALLMVVQGRSDAPARSPAELFSMLLYAALLTRPASALADLYGGLQWARGTLGRLESVLAIAPEAGLASGDTSLRATGEIAFRNIHFGYPGRESVFRGLNLTIKAGEIVALTGLNGAGKSTLIRLLLRFYDAQSGQILLDGQDIASLQVQHLRRQIGLVPQRPLLFNGTLRANVLMGFPDAREEDIARALELAQASEFVAALTHGLETQIGDHGVQLSGGQQQRVALARALLPSPPILVFDEATAMYDLSGEEAFVAACKGALKGRTVLLVTHRPASLALADRIVRIDDGAAHED